MESVSSGPHLLICPSPKEKRAERRPECSHTLFEPLCLPLVVTRRKGQGHLFGGSHHQREQLKGVKLGAEIRSPRVCGQIPIFLILIFCSWTWILWFNVLSGLCVGSEPRSPHFLHQTLSWLPIHDSYNGHHEALLKHRLIFLSRRYCFIWFSPQRRDELVSRQTMEPSQGLTPQLICRLKFF